MIRIERKKPLAPGKCEGVGVRFEGIEPTADVFEQREIVSSVSGEKVVLDRAWVECPECTHRMLTDFGRKRDKEGNLVSIGVTVPPHAPRKKAQEPVAEEAQESPEVAQEPAEVAEDVEAVAANEAAASPAPRRRRKAAAK